VKGIFNKLLSQLTLCKTAPKVEIRVWLACSELEALRESDCTSLALARLVSRIETPNQEVPYRLIFVRKVLVVNRYNATLARIRHLVHLRVRDEPYFPIGGEDKLVENITNSNIV